MKEVDPEFEIFQVTEAVSLSFQDFDLVIDPFDFAGSYAMVEVIQNASSMGRQLIGELR